jgi:quinohemoprotein ethanol dehydrogenase
MRAFLLRLLTLISVLAGTTACTRAQHAQERSVGDGADWVRFGRTSQETHFSPLHEIDAGNVRRLGLAWFHDLPVGPSVGVSQPLAVKGVLYFAVGYSVIYAMEAVTGRLLWQYDPDVFAHAGDKLRAGWGVRGIAYSNGKIFTATLDGRLIAIDTANGKPVWSAMTLEPNDSRYITGQPYVMNGKVVIGHGGADYAPVRGYVTAYDENTGKQVWRFYTVPGNPADGFENEAMAMAAKTWTGEWWKFGGGGTVWNAMAFDAQFNRLYIGTGNGSPWNQKIRSPGGGDNLFLCSIVALDADTGKYLWHYQINPGESWDFNASMDIELTDLTVNGERRPVILTAPKNGFFYVIDRRDGRLISAQPFARTTWAERIDLVSGRPFEIAAARYDGAPAIVFPSAYGAHGVEAMSFNPITGLVYLPARNLGAVYADPPDLRHWTHRPGMVINSGVGAAPAEMKVPSSEGWLAAWDPVAQREVWRVALKHTHNGGTLTTAGNLVMQGQATGELSVYAADTGKKLWSFDAQNGIMAAPITYLAHGRQYISLLVGWRAANDTGVGPSWDYAAQKRRVLTFALDAHTALQPAQPFQRLIIDDPEFKVDTDKAAIGAQVFYGDCYVCHGEGLRAGGAAPDLRKSPVPLDLNALAAIVRDGALRARGMPAHEQLTMAQIEGLQHFIRMTARQDLQSVEHHRETQGT